MSLSSVEQPELAEAFASLPLSVVFAEADAIEAARDGKREIELTPPYHVSDEDAYLVLPDDIGLELVDIFDDGDLELLAEALRDGVCVLGSVERESGRVWLDVETIGNAGELLGRMPFGETIEVGGRADPLEHLNGLEAAQVTVASELVDDEGLRSMLSEGMYVGRSWRVPKDAKHLSEVDPTYVFSRRLPDGRVSLEAALFVEYEELVILLRPALLSPSSAAAAHAAG